MAKAAQQADQEMFDLACKQQGDAYMVMIII